MKMSSLVQHVTHPLENNAITLLQGSIEDLASQVPSDKLVQFSMELYRSAVISKKVKDIFASLDHDRLDPQLSVRYIVQHVCMGVRRDVEVFHRFVKVLAGLGGSAEQFAKYLHEEWCVSERGEGQEGQAKAESSQAVGNDIFLSEDDVPALMKILAGVTYKWEILGIALGLSRAALEDCKSDKENALRFHRMLCVWVTGNYQNAKPATINNLKSGLACSLVGVADVAKCLEERFRKARRPCVPVLPVTERPSSNSTLTIVYQSIDPEVSDGKSTLLEVHVSPNESVFYQWMKDEKSLSDGLAFSGTSNDILVISPASQGIEGKFTCRISNASEEVITEEIALTVIFSPEKKRLIRLYSKRREIPSDSWPPFVAKIFISLDLIKKKSQGTDAHNYSGDEDCIRDKIEYEEVFGEFISGALVLIEGRPGSGKTTLVHKVTRDWAKRGNVLRNAKMVFLISLRSLARGKDKSLSDVLEPFYRDKEREKLVGEIDTSDGEEVCFIIDGLDEYHRQDERDSVIHQLLHQRETYLAEAMVIVASRPVATGTLRLKPEVTKRVEVLGFSKEQIFDYIHKYPFSSALSRSEASPAKLIDYLNLHPNILHICYLPVNVAMICYLYERRGEIPRTETKTYEIFIQLIVLRKLKRSNEEVRLDSLDDLPGEEKEHFRNICHLAFDMTIQSKQEVRPDEVPLFLGSSSDDAPFMGLVTIDWTAELYELDNTYAFLHLTIQEYLAAFYLAKCLDVETVLAYARQEHLQMVWKFYFGMVKFPDVAVLQYIVKYTNIRPRDDMLFEVQCAFESQQCDVCTGIVRERTGILNLCGCSLTPADLTAVGYVISTTSHPVTELVMGTSGLHDDHVKALLGEVSYNKLNSVRTLYLSHNSIGGDGAESLAGGLKSCNHLQTLELSNNSIGDDGAESLAGGLKSCNDLQTLDLSRNSIGDDGAAFLAGGLKSCNHLQTLDLSHNRIGDGAEALVYGRKPCNRLQTLNLSFNRIGDVGAEGLAGRLKFCNHLQTLYLSNNSIGDVGAADLAGGLKFCNHLQTLYLSSNSIGSCGAVALADVLKSCDNLGTLYLSSNSIGDRGAVALADGLKSCYNLQKLDLSQNSIGDCGAVALADGLKSCKNLETLNLSSNSIDDRGAIALADVLKSCKNLETLGLSSNSIADRGAVALADGLMSCPNLQVLNIYRNNIGTDSEEALEALYDYMYYNSYYL